MKALSSISGTIKKKGRKKPIKTPCYCLDLECHQKGSCIEGCIPSAAMFRGGDLEK
jgi:hypothetical protein